MRRHRGLWERLVSGENFEEAYRNSVRGKSSQRQVREFNKNREENLERVRLLVAEGKFRTSEYRAMKIYEPKERTIYRLPYSPDRIVQHAVMNVLRPIIRGLLIKDTYACIDGRGPHAASRRCSEFVRRNRYCLKCDIRKFYPSISQRRLSAMLHRTIADERFMAVVDNIVFSFPGGYNCPIGNYCSQWFGNFYLSRLDNFVKHTLRCRDYERYCDDFLLFSDDKAYLADCRRRIGAFLREELELEFSKCDLFSVRQGVDFCGYRHFGKYVLLRKSTAKRVKRRFRRGVSPQSEASMKGWLKHCCSWHFLQSLMSLKAKAGGGKSGG